jgi:hypothetical protein
MLNRYHNLLGIPSDDDNAVIALMGIPQPGCAPFVVGTLGSAFEASQDTDCFLTRSDERLIGELSAKLDGQILSALDARSASEFSQVRAQVWPKYCRSLRALSDTIRNMAPDHQIDRATKTAMDSYSEDLEKRPVRFGQKLREQALFTLWTLSKIRTLSFSLVAPPAPELRGKDLELCNEYRLCSLWTQFHMDVVIKSSRFDKAIPDDVQEVVCDGLRMAVNAYAIMKEAYALRHPRTSQPPADGLPWDEEDEQLLASSMRDLNGAADNL